MATAALSTLSLHDALPILFAKRAILESGGWAAAVSDDELVAAIRLLAEEAGIFTETAGGVTVAAALALAAEGRSEEHTSELQSHSDLVCRLLLEKKKDLKQTQPSCPQGVPNLQHRVHRTPRPCSPQYENGPRSVPCFTVSLLNLTLETAH